ncbi:MAG: VanZ family protein [Clostridia bacterium]|nr:VanZ family protein [Clostridia bacterium]
MKSVKKPLIFSWAAVLLCMAVIFILSAQKGDESQSLSDKLIIIFGFELSSDFIRTCAHFLEYAGLSVLLYNALYRSYGYFRPFLSVIISALYAVTDEVHQLFVEGRACQITDIIIDSIGAAAGAAVLTALIFIYRKLKRRKQG